MDLNFWPRLNKCCCCVSLRVGCLIIGYASLVSSAISLSAVSWSLYNVVYYVKNHQGKPDPNHSPEDLAAVALSLYITHAYFLFVLLYCFVTNLLLIVGVHMNRSNYIRYYFHTALFLLVLALALVVVTSVFLGFLATVPLLKWCVILFYCLIVVRSTYLEMEENSKPRVYEMQSLYNPQQAPFMAV